MIDCYSFLSLQVVFFSCCIPPVFLVLFFAFIGMSLCFSSSAVSLLFLYGLVRLL